MKKIVPAVLAAAERTAPQTAAMPEKLAVFEEELARVTGGAIARHTRSCIDGCWCYDDCGAE